MTSEAGEVTVTAEALLGVLSKGRLVDVGREFGVGVSLDDKKDALVAALTGSGRVRFRELLRVMGRDELKSACRSMGLDDSGRSRQVLMARRECRILCTPARRPSPRQRENERLRLEVREIYASNKGRYGSPRVHRELVGRGHGVGVHRVARIMRVEGLKARSRRRYRLPDSPPHDRPVAPNLLDRRFDVAEPNRVWVGDITYVPTKVGWAYLAVLLDLFSRRVVGWHVDTSPDTSLTLTALGRALALRCPAEGLLHHSDRGIQYAASDYQRALRGAGMTVSMSRRGNCWDNAVAESFFATLEKELLEAGPFDDPRTAAAEIGTYIESYYNAERRHSSLDYLSPIQYERLTQLKQSA